MTRARITVIGGAHVDRRGRINGDTKPGSSNPGSWFEEAGGGGFNAARNLALLGHDVSMISVSGGDAAGELVARAAERAGVALEGFTFLDRQTPSYTAILEADGNLVIALADMALYDLMTPRRLRVNWVRDRLTGSDLVLCDANLPAETIAALAALLKPHGVPLAGIGISPAKVGRCKGSLGEFTFLFMNEAEARTLAGPQDTSIAWPQALRAIGLRGGAITRGTDQAVIWSGDQACMLAPPKLDVIGDVTGAGDAFAAGALHAFLQGQTLSDIVKSATALASLTVRSPLAVAENINQEDIAAALALVQAPEMLNEVSKPKDN